MGKDNSSGLGKALTMLHLEDKFLQNGELSNYSLSERGKIANDIISEKLSRGRWDSVIRMMYGGFGKADALYDGDRNKLREDIVNSALEHWDNHIDNNLIGVLRKAGENDILFNLATKLPLKYEQFLEIRRGIDNDYFKNSEGGVEKEKILTEVQSKLAFAEGKYGEALRSFLEIGNSAGIDKFFKVVLSSNRYYGELNLPSVEEVALSDPSKKESRLRKLVMSFSSGAIRPLEALELQRKYNLKLSPKENEKIRGKIAKELSRYDLEKSLPKNESELRLLWAKEHAKSEPAKAYQIFNEQNYIGKEMNSAIISGLKLERRNNQERALDVRGVEENKLREVYPFVPFEVKVNIASHLNDKKSLIKLSKVANKNGELEKAYRLFVEGGGNLQDEYIDSIRKKIIKKDVEEHPGFLSFLDKSDKIGMIEAYKALIKSSNGKDKGNLRRAYEFARLLADEEMIQETRKLMISFSPSWALDCFKSSLGGISPDEVGQDNVLSEVASSSGIDKDALEVIVKKYNKD